MSMDICQRCDCDVDTDWDMDCYVGEPRKEVCICEYCREKDEELE